MWPNLKHHLFNNQTEDRLDEMIKLLEKYDISEEDLEGAMKGLVLLLSTYRFNITNFVNGKIRVPEAQALDHGKQNLEIEDAKMSINDIELLAKVAFNEQYYDIAVEVGTILKKIAIERQEPEATIKRIKTILKTMVKSHDQHVMKPKDFTSKARTFLKPVDLKLAKTKKFAKIKHFKKPKIDTPLFTRNVNDADFVELFEAACRGEKLRNPEVDKDMKCMHLHYQNPYLKLGPFKMEVMSQDPHPFVGVFHDFFSDKEIDSYLNLAKGKTFRSMHSKKAIGGGEEEGAKSLSRTSHNQWIYDLNHDGQLFTPDAIKVTYRIRNATLMNPFATAGGEAYQVANYGIGGQYTKHYDAVGAGVGAAPLLKQGDRVQTFMGYLSDVEAGGATAFPLLGLSVWPKKGDAITWYNLHRNGLQDKLTSHGGCPVIKGSKWITNKWIHWHNQDLTLPCNVDQNHSERLKPLSNDKCSFLHNNCKAYLHNNHELIMTTKQVDALSTSVRKRIGQWHDLDEQE